MSNNESTLEHNFPTRLKARVVSPSERPMVHGFDLYDDLVLHFSSAERFLLALSGDEPDAEKGALFEHLEAVLYARGIDEGPAHAATLTRLFSQSDRAVLSTLMTSLVEQGFAFASWLHGAKFEVCLRLQAEALADHMGYGFASTRVVFGEAFRRLGLHQDWQVAACWCRAATGTALAEAMLATVMDFENYPMNLPAVECDHGD